MILYYLFVSPTKNSQMVHKNISDFREGEHGIYFFNEDGVKCFVNWNNIGTYSLFLTEEDENDT